VSTLDAPRLPDSTTPYSSPLRDVAIGSRDALPPDRLFSPSRACQRRFIRRRDILSDAPPLFPLIAALFLSLICRH